MDTCNFFLFNRFRTLSIAMGVYPPRYFPRHLLISVDWLATHCHVPFSFTHVSVKRPRREYGFPFATPFSR
jgi:hypothetical protein